MNLYWDRVLRKMVVNEYSKQAITEPMDVVLRDTYSISLGLVLAQSNLAQPYTFTTLASGESIIFGAKLSSALAGDYLFNLASFTATGSGTSTRYVGSVTLATTALIAALGSSAYLDVLAELTVVDASNNHLDSTQWDMRVWPDVNRGTEGAIYGDYSVIEQFTDSDSIKKVRIVNSEGVTCAVFSPL